MKLPETEYPEKSRFAVTLILVDVYFWKFAQF